MDPAFGERYLNEGFSGGEKKRNEILQMAMLEPELAVLDETDSGLDIDALRAVARGVQTVRGSATRARRAGHHPLPADARRAAPPTGSTCWSTASSSPRADRSWPAARGGGVRRMARLTETGTRLTSPRSRKDFPLLGRRSTASRSSTSTRPSSSQRPSAVLDAMRQYDETTHANVHRGVYAIAEEATRRFEAARVNVGPVHRCARPGPRDGVHQERHRGASTWWPTPGAGPTSQPATSSSSPRWSTTPTSCRGTCWPQNGASSCGGSRSTTTAGSSSTISTGCSTGRSCSAVTCMSNVLGTINPMAEHRRRRPRRRGRGGGRRRPVRPPPADRRDRPRGRLPRLQRPQDARPDRHRRALGHARSC